MTIKTKEKLFEEDVEAYLTSPDGGYLKCDDKHSLTFVEDLGEEEGCSWQQVDGGYRILPGKGVDIITLANFIQTTQPKAWERFKKTCDSDPLKKLANAFQDAVDRDGIVRILKHGFKHRGITFKVLYFAPENSLNEASVVRYRQNACRCIRQFHFSATGNQTVDIVLDLNGIPVVGIELKDQFTNQTYENAEAQWKRRDARESCFKFKNRMIAFFAVDTSYATMATELKGDSTYFLPINQGTNGAGFDGEKGNPACEDGYPVEHLWKTVLQKDSLIDIINKFLHLEKKDNIVLDKHGNEKTVTKERIIFPRYHQLDAVRKLVADVKENGTGKNYLIQHSAGSGKSNSIAWVAYRLASLFNEGNTPIFDSVVVVTDRRVLDAQLQETISGFDHQIGSVCVIDKDMHASDLRDALNGGKRLIVSTLQKFPVIFEEVENTGKHFAVVIDEAHSSQTGRSAQKLKTALADLTDPLREYAEIEAEDEEARGDSEDELVNDMAAHGRHKNLTFCAFTATPKNKTLEMFGNEMLDGSFRPFHVYSMRQAIQEGFILNPLDHYVAYSEAVEIAKTAPDNPDVPTSPTMKLLRKYKELHPYAIGQKAAIIVETFRNITSKAIKGKGKMMVVTASRLATVRYFHEVKRYMQEKGYNDIEVLVAFSGSVIDPADPDGVEYTEPSTNVGHDGARIAETQTKKEFRFYGDVLIVAEKYQTGFDEPLLHTMVIDKKLKDVKAVQTLCRVNRIHPDKHDTFILDFVNDPDKIKEAFGRYYSDAALSRHINVDLIYRTQTELRDFEVYEEEDIEAASLVAFGKDDKRNVQGRLSSALKPAVVKYEALDDDVRYQFRRKVRSFCKWYAYITQITRMFDKDLHKEYVYLSYLQHLLEVQKIVVESVDDKVEMRFYKLEKSFDGSIELEAINEPLDQIVPLRDKVIDKKTDPLQIVIDRINEQYVGDFTDEDRVVLRQLAEKLEADGSIKNSVGHDGSKIFKNNIFPKVFGEVARQAFKENMEAFESMFSDAEKYQAIMNALAEMFVQRYQMN